MQTLMKLEKYTRGVSFAVALTSAVCLVIMVLLIVVDVFLRKMFNSPILGSYEIVQYLLMVTVFASFAFTQSEKGHIRVTMFTNLLPWRLHSAFSALGEILGAGLIFMLAYAAALQAQYVRSEGVVSDVLKFSITPFFWVEAVSMAVFGFVLLFDSACNIAGIFNRDYADKLFKDYV